jgi:hypothetical protein
MTVLTDAVYTFQHMGSKCHFTVVRGASSVWAQEQGATYTLYTSEGPRAAKMTKSRAYIGVDEDADGNMVWEIWPIRITQTFSNDRDMLIRSWNQVWYLAGHPTITL